MSVRRLADDDVQPAEFAFSAGNLAWARAQIAKYPAGRQASAVIPILWRAQEQSGGWLPKRAIEVVADLLDMARIRVLEVATFYTMFQLAPVGRKAHVQVCGTTPCVLRGAEELIKVCRRRIHEEPFEVSADGNLSWEEVECLGACVNAPMVLIGSDTYEDLTAETFTRVLEGLLAGKPVRPGPQTDRQTSAPTGAPTPIDRGSGPKAPPVEASIEQQPAEIKPQPKVETPPPQRKAKVKSETTPVEARARTKPEKPAAAADPGAKVRTEGASAPVPKPRASTIETAGKTKTEKPAPAKARKPSARKRPVDDSSGT